MEKEIFRRFRDIILNDDKSLNQKTYEILGIIEQVRKEYPKAFSRMGDPMTLGLRDIVFGTRPSVFTEDMTLNSDPSRLGFLISRLEIKTQLKRIFELLYSGRIETEDEKYFLHLSEELAKAIERANNLKMLDKILKRHTILSFFRF